ncbi:MAG: DUF1549 domain-containing protein, partial [Pirellulales bacterium]|nr:DUF1549 domain-containing protein [Pirellulales bacterium]
MGFTFAFQSRLVGLASFSSDASWMRWITLICLGQLLATPVTAQDPLHVRIDRQMAEIHPGPENDLCGDGEFLRRVYLDLVGRIPTGQQARRFIEDPAPDKRAQVVDQLLAHPDHPKHMAHVFDVMLMERRADKHVKKDAWNSYLLTSFQQNKPFDQLAREILAADGVDEKQRAPAKFFLEREVEPNLMTREVGRMFFGMDLQCAQCHDHPLIDDYYQADYYGLFAFVNRSYLFQPDNKKPAVLAEKAEGDAKYKSVFTDEEGSTLPRLPGGVEIDEPTFAKDDAYQVKPDPKKKDVRPIPKHSRRHELAMRATDGSNRAFNRNIANRLWAHMMGQGLVQPVDQHHSDNPPVQPELLEMLATELAKTKFDVRAMLRQFALSRTYQRSIDLPEDLAVHAHSATEELKLWEQRLVERKQRVEQAKAEVNDLENRLDAGKETLPPLAEAAKKAGEAMAAARMAADQAKQTLQAGEQALAKQQSVLGLLSEAASKAEQAAGSLPDDQPLNQAVKVLLSRRDQANAKVAEQSQAVSSLKSSHSDAVNKLEQSSQLADQAAKKLKSAQQSAVSLAGELAQAEQKLVFGRTLISHAKEQVERLQATISFGQTVQQHQTLQAAVERLTTQIDQTQAAVDQLAPRSAQFSQELPQVEAVHSGALAAAETAKRQHESARQTAEWLADSFAKAKQVAELMSEDAELGEVVKTLEARSSDLAEKATSLQKLAAEASTKEQEVRDRLSTLGAQLKQTSDQLAQA